MTLSGQTFATSDLLSIGSLVILEALLSADNALVLAIMVRHLPEDERKKALLYGLGGAFVFRLIAILFATVVLEQWWLQAAGGAYLLFLAIKHFVTSGGDDEHGVKKPKGGFWPTVIAVEMTDIAFALDSVLAGIAFISRPQTGVQEDKIWVVVAGAMIGIVLLRLGAAAFAKLLDRYPGLDHVAYTLVGWVGLKLLSHAFHRAHVQGTIPFEVPGMSEAVFWGGMAVILLLGVGMAVAKRKPRAEGH
ncbi:tellurium resistance protein TerC [bacterium]|nr:MAG: tellurium resistance protein TerC [bacterium]